VLPDGADAKGWYVSLSRARDSMHVYTRDKAALRQSVLQPGERKSVWELVKAAQQSNSQSRHAMMPDLWAAPSGNRSRDGNGTLDLCRRVPPIEQNSNQKDMIMPRIRLERVPNGDITSRVKRLTETI